MQTRIRQGIFETNSSSSHSITIDMKGKRDAKIPRGHDGDYHIYAGEFGWEVEDYTDAPTKASYALTYAANNAAQRDMLSRVLAKRLGGTVVLHVERDEITPYIDHQSDHVCANAFASEDALEAFIFSPASALHTDNDNH
jgi:hypothetical protein